MDNKKTWPIVAPGIYLEARAQPSASRRPGLFLDRDGVIIVDKGFVSAPEDVELVPGAPELIAAANRCAVPVAVVTNQSGIARQKFGWAEFAAVEREISHRLAAAGARLDAVLACPFHPEFTANYGEAEAHWRKPGPGLVLAAARHLNIDIESSWLIGDQPRDIEAAKNAALAGAIRLSETAELPPEDSMRLDANTGFRTPVTGTLLEALALLRDAGLFVEPENHERSGPLD